MIRALLDVAAAEATHASTGGGAVLFGATLREAIITALHSASGNTAAVTAHPEIVQLLAQRLSELVRAQPDRLGSKEWLWLFRNLLGPAVEQGTIGELSDERIAQVLAGGAVQ